MADNTSKKWGAEAVAALESGYNAEATDTERAEQVETLMETLGKSKREVIGKLVNLGHYVAPVKPKAAKKDEGPTKGEILTAIEEAGFDASGFDNATKDALKRLEAFVVENTSGD